MANSRNRKAVSSKVTVVKNMRDYSNDPAILKKEKMVRAFIEKKVCRTAREKIKGSIFPSAY